LGLTTTYWRETVQCNPFRAAVCSDFRLLPARLALRLGRDSPGTLTKAPVSIPNFDHRNVQSTERDIDYLKRYRVGLGTVEKLTGFAFMTALDDRAHRILAEECPDTMLH
jgi:hypothetical protein